MPSTAESNERLFCWEQVHATNPLFRISRVFAPHEQAERLLPLYALFSVLEQLCSQATDLDLASRKLDWWRSECLPGSLAASGHPILKELGRTGAALSLDQSLLKRLFDSVESRLDATAPLELDDLERLCRWVAEPQYRLESRLCAVDPSVEAQTHYGACARNGLVQLIRESARPGGAGRFWWLPLKLLARHGVSRAELGHDPDRPAARALFGEILQQARGWAGAAGERGERAPTEPPAMRHFVVFSHLQSCALRRLRDTRPSRYAAALRRAGAAELFRAWQAARRVSRP
jgi:phytoene/squalene synthetase